MIIGILSHKVVPVDNFVELTDGLRINSLLIIGKSQQVKIGVAPSTGFALICLQVWNCFGVLF